ncbi:hypothetical protein SASPL_120715 [Salvia splendens]|uniref:Histone-lysine N-methyltransferase SUV39H n=1 Tax=Salvia splendens TaxID=180675 RepID=A0A8X8ZVW6_SALSN|nr:histone-lysine N-methyltransferase, H3 lysine-9 specific SUVH6-like [Salvia splendens]KAG6418511.1 hypothetical protein SASPL_120715 [Salvia splendens]
MPPIVTSKKYYETAGFRNVLPSQSSAASVVTGQKYKWSGNGKISSSSDGGKHGKAIAAIPLRSLPSYDVKQKPEKSVLSHDKEYDEGRKEGKTSGDMNHEKEDLWTLGMDELGAVIADAKEFVSLLDSSYSMLNTFLDAINVLKDSGESKGQHPSLNSDALTRCTSIDQSLSRKRLKVSSGVALVVQEENACGAETMPEDEDARGTETMLEDKDARGTETMPEDKDARGTETMSEDKDARETETMSEDKDARGTETMSEDEDEVRISSPAVQEENACGTETMLEDEDARGTENMSKDKDARGTETMSEDEDEVRISSPAVQEENACGTETMPEDEDARGTEIMSKDEDEVRISSPAVQEENACGTKTMSEDEDARGTETMSEDEDEDEVRILSPVQEENACGTETMSEDEDEITILTPAEWKVSQLSVNKKNECVKPHGTVDVDDYADQVSVATKADQPVESFPNRELNRQHDYFTDSGECSRESEGERCDDASTKMFPEDDGASGTYSLKCTDEHEYAENHKRLINFEIVPCDHPKGRKVMEALKLFKEEYDKVSQHHESEPGVGKTTKGPHYVAAENVRLKGMDFSPDKPFGHIPGIEIGHEFSFRTELAIAGLNNQTFKGIDCVNVDCTMCATSVVDSGRYENKAKEHDILIYSGEGGNSNVFANSSSDQKLVRGNLALVNSMKKEFPVRVIHKRTGPTKFKQLGAMPYVYVYDGLYKVNKYWQERDNQSCKLVYKFELQRLPGQPRIGVIPDERESLPGRRRNHGTDATGRKPVKEVCVVDDISLEKEKFKVRAMNGVDDEHPPPFTYTIKNVYPHLYWLEEPAGCDCVDGCSDSVQCPCIKKNGGEIPYNENGQLLKSMTNGVIHECGPSCKCPPSCMNRVSQGGTHPELEIFKTKSMGWGVRSRNHILPGSFICEYVGEILSETEANQKIGKDEYLFDMCHGKSQDDDYALDAASYGNIGRFINHSCDPNVFTQKVFYDHEDKKMPHIMFFAGKKIPARHELMNDYNYANVIDAHGKLKSKACHCGSRKCKGKLY